MCVAGGISLAKGALVAEPLAPSGQSPRGIFPPRAKLIPPAKEAIEKETDFKITSSAHGC